MWQCPACGRQNETGVTCFQCGGDLPEESAQRESEISIDDFAFDSYAYTRVDWARLYHSILRHRDPTYFEPAWDAAKVQWCERLKADLGGSAQIWSARDVLLLTDISESQARAALSFADQIHGSLRVQFADLAHSHARGRVPILLFTDETDYYEYLSYFYPDEGTFPQSCGVYLSSDGCPHVAARHMAHGQTAITLAHELSHLMLSHLPLPGWVNEGVAMRLPRVLAASFDSVLSKDPAFSWWTALADAHQPLFSDDILERHQQFWNEENIQEFWAGTSFHEPSEIQELSYSLAEILVTKFSEDWPGFVGFLAAVQSGDGGQTAALDHLGTCLGGALEPILGPGYWRPVRKELVNAWKRANWVDKEPEGGS